jgi:diguanylate cyclase (GGDEF)-like protein
MAVGLDIDSPDALWNVVGLTDGQSVTLIRDDGYIQLRRGTQEVKHETLYSRAVDWKAQTGADPLNEDSVAEVAYLPKLRQSIVSAYTDRYVTDRYVARMTDPLLIFFGAILVSLVLYRFVSRSQQRYEDRLIYHATHDTLTGMPNRALIADRIGVEIAHAKRRGGMLGVMYLDLDNFKQINDSYGHEYGDRLLQAAAGRMRECLRDEDTLGRMGGDEFVILIPALKSVQQAELLGERVRDAFEQPFELFDSTYFVNASIGIAIYPDDGEDAALLLSRADTAL